MANTICSEILCMGIAIRAGRELVCPFPGQEEPGSTEWGDPGLGAGVGSHPDVPVSQQRDLTC